MFGRWVYRSPFSSHSSLHSIRRQLLAGHRLTVPQLSLAPVPPAHTHLLSNTGTSSSAQFPKPPPPPAGSLSTSPPPPGCPPYALPPPPAPPNHPAPSA